MLCNGDVALWKLTDVIVHISPALAAPGQSLVSSHYGGCRNIYIQLSLQKSKYKMKIQSLTYYHTFKLCMLSTKPTMNQCVHNTEKSNTSAHLLICTEADTIHTVKFKGHIGVYYTAYIACRKALYCMVSHSDQEFVFIWRSSFIHLFPTESQNQKFLIKSFVGFSLTAVLAVSPPYCAQGLYLYMEPNQKSCLCHILAILESRPLR